MSKGGSIQHLRDPHIPIQDFSSGPRKHGDYTLAAAGIRHWGFAALYEDLRITWRCWWL